MRNPFRRRQPLEERQLMAPWIVDLPDWYASGNASGEPVTSTSVLGLSAAWDAVGLLASARCGWTSPARASPGSTCSARS